jgi:hypothetical protein
LWPDHSPSGNQKRFATEAVKTLGVPQPLSLTRIGDDGRRFIVHADELLTAFVEPEREVLT